MLCAIFLQKEKRKDPLDVLHFSQPPLGGPVFPQKTLSQSLFALGVSYLCETLSLHRFFSCSRLLSPPYHMIVYTRKRKRECVEAAARCADANAAPAQPASVHIQPHPAAPSAGAPQPHGTATAGPEPSARTRGAPVGRVRRRRDTLSEEEIGRVLAAVSHKDAPPNKIVKQYGGIPLRVEDICALLSPRAIDDTIIDCYMCLLRQRQDQWGGQRGYPRCHFLHTCFFALLTGLCHCKREYNPHRVQFVNYEALLDSECILVPINCNGNHWCLAAIYPGSRRIVCADSLSGNKEDDTTRFIFRVRARQPQRWRQQRKEKSG